MVNLLAQEIEGDDFVNCIFWLLFNEAKGYNVIYNPESEGVDQYSNTSELSRKRVFLITDNHKKAYHLRKILINERKAS